MVVLSRNQQLKCDGSGKRSALEDYKENAAK
jgi:hypothetical protein